MFSVLGNPVEGVTAGSNVNTVVQPPVTITMANTVTTSLQHQAQAVSIPTPVSLPNTATSLVQATIPVSHQVQCYFS